MTCDVEVSFHIQEMEKVDYKTAMLDWKSERKNHHGAKPDEQQTNASRLENEMTHARMAAQEHSCGSLTL
tara:strand:+ start:405 stop:614 length:210 start_codon:yes stop_codon:yes gene_type:complete